MSSIKARKSQFEGDHQQKKANEAKKVEKNPETSDEEEEDEGSFEFADLVRVLTGGGDGEGENAIDALQETFKILDADGDGSITLSDLRVAMNGFHEVDEDDVADDENVPDDEELAEMIAAADDRGNGKISFESFVKVIDPKLAAKTFPTKTAIDKRRLSGARLTITNK